MNCSLVGSVYHSENEMNRPCLHAITGYCYTPWNGWKEVLKYAQNGLWNAGLSDSRKTDMEREHEHRNALQEVVTCPLV